MKHYMKAFFSSAVLALLAATSVQAGSEEKIVIALKTGGFELQETGRTLRARGPERILSILREINE